jgi:outer membrane protein W
MFMRKLLVILIATALVQTCPAQSQDTSSRVFKKFKVDISVGYASPSSSSSSSQGSKFNGGALFAIEPKFAVIDPLAIGVRVEAAVIAHIYNNNNNSNNSNGKANLSYLLTADYYFTKSSFRPFIGAGGGIYSTATIDSNVVNSNSSSVPYTSQFGFMARAGFELGHLRIGAEYNFVSNNASYLGLKIGVCIGGGRKKK